ncbi:fimbrial assembly protein (PilN) [bacterium BMS3Bbin14]|nr:fimbrial assembly protein (PilN) [bacterium BMS3Bbin14]HDO30085.1 hypothetical protein [Desulfobacteraceae bacterium]
MKRRILGLDINDDLLAAVVVERKAGDRQIISCGYVRLDDQDSIPGQLPALLEQVGWQGGDCLCGISLVGCSLRNLTLPFTDQKKIRQVLPFELEDQLLTPVSEQVLEYIVAGTSAGASHLLIAGLEKKSLQLYLDGLVRANLSPETVTLRTMVLAEQFLGSGESGDFLMLDAGLHAMNMVICHHGRIVFIRRLPYPDRMFTVQPFTFRDGRAGIAHHDEAVSCIAGLCDAVRLSMDFFRLDSGFDIAPEQVILTGCMAQAEVFPATIQAELGLDASVGDLRRDAGVTVRREAAEQWQPACLDHALALALAGLKKKPPVNFRKDEFAPKKIFFATRRHLLAASILLALMAGGGLVLFWMHYLTLQERNAALTGQMTAIYKETFPQATRIVDPLIQMRAGLRTVQDPAAAIPVFSGDKRVLNILADISARTPNVLKIHVARLVIDQKTVVIKGTTDSFNSINIMRGSLGRSPLYDEVKIVSATADKDKGLVRFALRLHLGGAS